MYIINMFIKRGGIIANETTILQCSYDVNVINNRSLCSLKECSKVKIVFEQVLSLYDKQEYHHSTPMLHSPSMFSEP